MSQKVSEEDARGIKKWLKAIGLSSDNWPRTFDDACHMAHILKKMYPSLINFHLFQHRINTDAKFMNWELLNRVGLKPMRMTQSRDTLRKLANGAPGVILPLLLKVMTKYIAKFPLPVYDEITALNQVEKNIDECVQEQELEIQACKHMPVTHGMKEKNERANILLKKLSYLSQQAQELSDLESFHVNKIQILTFS